MFNRNRRNVHDNFDRQFNFVAGFIKVVFFVVFFGVISIFGIVGYTAYTIASDPSGTANSLGGLVKDFQEGMQDEQR